MNRPQLLRTVRIGLVVLAPLAPGALGDASAHAATIAVDTTTDEVNADGDCSLREAVLAADADAVVDECAAGSGGDTVDLPVGVYVLGGEQVTIGSDLTISGAGRPNTAVDGNHASPVFGVAPDAGHVVTFSGLTVRNGTSGGERGGGICAGGADTDLTLKNVTLDGNTADLAGGLAPAARTVISSSTFSNNTAIAHGGAMVINVPSFTMRNSVLRDNHAGQAGGAIWSSDGLITLENVTISGNTAGNGGGAIHNFGGTISLYSSTVAGNHAGGISSATGEFILANDLIGRNFTASGGEDCRGTFTSRGYNLVQRLAPAPNACTILGDPTGNVFNVDPMLAPLRYNGGKTNTRALLSGSPAIDAGNPAAPGGGGFACAATDQRGVTRPKDGDGSGSTRCDIGAYELEPAAAR